MAESEVRYCTTEDGVSIAYSVTGQGPSLLLMQPGPSHLELVWRTPRYTDLLEWLSRENSLILPDPRGCGMSQREGFDIDFDLDYAAVVSAVGVDRLILFAMSGGGPNAIRFAATRPELVERLVLWNTWAATATNLRDPRIGAILPMVSTDWVTFTEALVAALSGWREPEAARAYAAMMREAITQSAWLRAMEVSIQVDVSKLLPAIQAKTLVVNNPAAIHPDTAKQLIAGISNARLRVIEGSSIMVSFDDPKIRPWLRAFLDGKEAPDDAGPTPASAPPSAALRTVLFTDLVGHTEMMSRLGDEMGRAVLREHETITRNVLKQHGGTEVKTMGDGFMASFGSVTKAVECAIALQRAFAERNSSSHPEAIEGLSVRVGLNAGEPIEEDGDLFGATVILASRIAAKAEGGEILVADTVRGLCSGKGFLFADRGEFVAKGFEEPVRVYEVRWRDG